MYYADTGNFSAAGAVNMRYRDRLDAPLLLIESGEDSYHRGLLAASPEVGDGTLLFGVDYSQNDGPWLLEENFRKTNALLRYSRTSESGRLAVTAQGYEGDWRSTDQIPQRAVDAGALDRFGFIDPLRRRRFASLQPRRGLDRRASAPESCAATRTPSTTDSTCSRTSPTRPISRTAISSNSSMIGAIYGGAASWRRPLQAAGLNHEVAAGVEMRRDDIDAVGLYRTVGRQRIGVTREDAVVQSSYSILVESHDRLEYDYVRTSIGLRADYFDFDVDEQSCRELRARVGFDRESPLFAHPRAVARHRILRQRRQGIP